MRAKWVDQGVPVILGEYGVETRPGKNLEARAYWNEYINRAAALNGIKTFYWDNGAPSTGNTFRIFDRNTGAIVDQQVLDAILRGSGVGNPGVMYTLTTQVNGMGTVSRNPTGNTFPGGTDVTLTATPASGNDFVGWTGDASGSANPKVVRILGNTSVTGNFVPTGTGGSGTILREYWLNVTGGTVASLTSSANYPNNPTGSGPLTSFEGPTNIGGQLRFARARLYPSAHHGCVHVLDRQRRCQRPAAEHERQSGQRHAHRVRERVDRFAPVDQVPLAALGEHQSRRRPAVLHRGHPEGGHGRRQPRRVLAGPGHGAGRDPRQLPVAVRATGGGTFALSVTKAGTGTGTVTSSTDGINCGATCSANFTSGTSVTLTAAAASGSTFTGWSGACTGTSTCAVSMTQARSVTATFTSQATTFALTVTKRARAPARSRRTPAASTAAATCSANIASGTSVTLTAAAASGSTFAGWSGACTRHRHLHGVDDRGARRDRARSTARRTFALSVTQARAPALARSPRRPAGINCGTTCTANYATGTSVTLTAAAASGSTFAGWSGACTGTGTCTVSMTQARNVTATFNSTAATSR